MKNFKISIDKCRVIFLDLEFYVPESGRDKEGLCYNPWDKKCKFLGGSFFVANPTKDFSAEISVGSKAIQCLWLWDYNSEKELLTVIYELLKEVYGLAKKGNNGRVSPILCGIGITSSDVPVLFDLFKRYKIMSNYDAFQFQSSFRIIDISQLAIATFNNSSSFAYPKTKGHILNKYLPGKKFESGKAVWDLYESKKFDEIEFRVRDEIVCTHLSYISILNDYKKFKNLEKNAKKNSKEITP